MIKISYKPKFIKKFEAFGDDLKDEILEKIKLFQDPINHKQLKVHKLHGSLKDQWSFSANYKIRIVFYYLSKRDVVLLTVGDHDLYK